MRGFINNGMERKAVMREGRDYAIEVVRFIATVGIAIFHFEWIYIGHPIYFAHFYLWVEFFFVLSGFFLVRNILKKNEEGIGYVVQRTMKQAIKLWKPYIIGFAFCFFVYCIRFQISGLKSVLGLLWNCKWEIIFLQLSSFDGNAPIINGVTGYIPALLFASAIITYLLIEHRKLTQNLLIIILPIFIYSHIINVYGNLSQWSAYENWYTIGMLRGLAGMLVGAGAYIYGENVKDRLNKWNRVILLCICIIFIVGMVLFRDKISYSDEIIYPYVFSVLVALIYFRDKKEIHHRIKNVILYLGKSSYNMFLLHYGICYLFSLFIPEKRYCLIAIVYLSIVIVSGLLLELLFNVVSKKE